MFVSAVLHSKPKLELVAVFSADHSFWKCLSDCILKPTKLVIFVDNKVVEQVLNICRNLSESDVNSLVGFMNSMMELCSPENITSVLSDVASDKASEFAEFIYTLSNIINSLKITNPLRAYFERSTSKNMCDAIMKSLREVCT